MIIDFPKEAHIPALRALWKEAFGDTDAFLDSFYSTGFSLYRCLCLRQISQPLAALYWFDCHWQDRRIAYIYGVATAKSHRGQGLCHKLMKSAQNILLQLGYSGVVLVPAKPNLFSFYESMGYTTFGGIRQWEATAGSEKTDLCSLTYKEYAAARKERLPEGSVIQEGALLRFMSSYTGFYSGKDLLLCAAKEDDKLIVYELLGDADAAPGILAALGGKEGIFRTVGTSPFAMYRSLTDDHTAPTYFAFALD